MSKTLQIIVLGILLSASLFSQQNNFTTDSSGKLIVTDTVKFRGDKKKVYARPRTATIMSACLPGLGQVYNKSYWKVPVIYAGIGGFGYMFIQNNSSYKYYRKNLIAEYDDDANTLNESGYTGDQLAVQKVYYRKFRDLAAIGIGVFYLLNVIDANVDAHLKTFDVSDDLSLQIDPWFETGDHAFQSRSITTGISLKFKFK